MARVTVEDCVDEVQNRFELIMLAAQRAKQISSGSALTIDRDRDKNPVVALREIADQTISLEDLKEDLVRVRQRVLHVEDEDTEDVIDSMDGEEDTTAVVSSEHVEITDQSDDGESGLEEEGEPSLEDLAGGSEKVE